MAQQETIEIHIDADIKLLAERASAVLGYATLDEFVSNLIREHAPAILQRDTSIYLTNTRFDNFITIYSDTERKPSTRIMDAARKLDTEGY